jgi:hypothetical protein
MSAIPKSRSDVNTRFNKANRSFSIAWWLLIAALSLALVFSIESSLADLSAYLGLWLLISACCFYFARNWSFSKYTGLWIDPLEIPVYISLTTMVLINIFGIAPYLDNRYLIRQLASVDELPIGLALTGLGLLSMWIGYGLVVHFWAGNARAKNGQLNGRRKLIDFDSPSMNRLIVFYAVLVLFRLLLFAVGFGERFGKTISFGEWNQWLYYPVELRWLILALVVLQVLRKRWPKRLAVVVIGFETLMGVVSGWSSTLLKMVFIIAGCYIYHYKKIPVRSVLVGGFIFVVFLVYLVPLSRYNRSVSSNFSVDAITGSLSQGIELFWTQNQGVIYAFNLLVERQTATAQTSALFIKLSPTYVQYRPIDELLLVPFSFIPRAFWPGKPEYGILGGVITRDYFGITYQNIGASAATLIGSAYIYGGGWIVVPSMFLFGVVSAVFYASLAEPALRGKMVSLLALYIGVVITNLHIGEGDILGLWQGFIQGTAVFLVFLMYLCTRLK